MLLEDLLQQLEDTLENQNTPERNALEQLRPLPRRYGYTEKVYDNEALAIWEDLLRKNPNDLDIKHHLAIAYHARAFDQEVSNDPTTADSDWKRALQLWHQLWGQDHFWDELAQRAGITPQVMQQERTEWLKKLLQVHFDIAFDEQTRNYRKKTHIDWALSSPFPKESKEQVRSETYDREALQKVEKGAWNPNTVESTIIDPALKIICEYLDLDEEYLKALIDLLALLVKRQYHFFMQVGAADNPNQKREIAQKIGEHRHKYDPYIQRLEKQIQTLEPASQALSDLISWHSLNAQALFMLEDYELAASDYRRALTAAERSEDRQSQEIFKKQCCLCLLLAARNAAAPLPAPDPARARRLLNNIPHNTPLESNLRMIRVQTYLLLDELNLAKEECEVILRDLPHEGEISVDERQELESNCRKLLNAIQQRQIQPLLEQATQRLQADDAVNAIRILTEALDIYPDSYEALFLRSQCYLRELDLDAASAHLMTAENLATRDNNREALSAIANLRQELEQLQRLVQNYGGVRSYRLRLQAVEAYNREQFQQAAELYRQALRNATAGRTRMLEQELAGSLNSMAIMRLNDALRPWENINRELQYLPAMEAQQQVIRRHNQIQTILQEALENLYPPQQMLQEATRLDAGNAVFRENLSQVNKYIAQFQQML